MHLAQHHFQTQSRVVETSVRFALSQLFFAPWGLVRCELDGEALRGGTVSLLHARGIMPDGLPFHFPDASPPPPARAIRELLSPLREAHTIHLALPPYRPGAANCTLPPSAAADGAPGRMPVDRTRVRYTADTQRLADETTGLDERPVDVARPNFRLLVEGEDAADLVTLAVARVRRDGAGHLGLDPDFVPPVLQIGAQVGDREPLMELLARLIEVLAEKSEAMGAAGADGAPGEELPRFWLRHAVHAALAPLSHLFRARTTHPERLYVELARLGGALCTFALDADPQRLPAYDHERLGDCFRALDRHIRTHLELSHPTNCLRIPLRPLPDHDFYYLGDVADPRALRASWILALRTALPRSVAVDQVPRLVKLCSGDGIVKLVQRQYPGMTLTHLPSPPTAVAPRADTLYFAVGPDAGEICWSFIDRTRTLGVYAPDALRIAHLEMLAVLGG
jgi:type VI secretion system protein ImpJ